MDFKSLQRQLNADNSQSKCVYIKGAVGDVAENCNGAYEPTSEIGNGRVRYRKYENSDIWIDHYQDQWGVKSAGMKGTSTVYGFVHGACALEACGSRTWKVVNERTHTYEEQSGVKMEFMDKVSTHNLFCP
jgi:hypothetical protein